VALGNLATGWSFRIESENVNPPAWVKDAWDLIVWPALCRAGNYIRRHPLPVVVAVVVALTGFVVWESYRRTASREITVLIGPPGSSGRRMGTRVAEQLDVTSPGPGVQYGTSLRSTQGYEEMRDILSTDKKGLTVGFAIDDGGTDSNLRVLMPLDWDYLHVLVRTKFLQDNFAARPQWPSQLGDVVEQLGERKVFIGPTSSGTRRIAQVVLEKYFPVSRQRKIADLVAPDIDDWEEVQSALRSGKIDLAFYTGPIESKTVQEIAGEGTAVLLGLNDIADAVARGRTGRRPAAISGPRAQSRRHPRHFSRQCLSGAAAGFHRNSTPPRCGAEESLAFVESSEGEGTTAVLRASDDNAGGPAARRGFVGDERLRRLSCRRSRQRGSGGGCSARAVEAVESIGPLTATVV
jgi:hypothetical protein